MPPAPEQLDELSGIFERLAAEGLRPVLSRLDMVAHHGTDVDAARNIVREQYFRMTGKKGRLGPGIYFYESEPLPGLDAALDWAKNRPGCAADTIPSVVSARLQIDRVFDMFNPANSQYLNRLMRSLTNLIGPADAPESWEQFTGKVVGLFAPESRQIQAIRGPFHLPTLRALIPGRTHHRPEAPQKGLAVRDRACIFNIRLARE